MIKNALTIAPWIIIVVILIWFTQCQKPKPCPEIVSKTDTIRTTDTIKIKGQTISYPDPYEVIRHDTTFKDVDTLKIISNYLAENKYELILTDDTNSKITLYASVQFNLLKDFRTDAVFYPHTTTINNTEYITTPARVKLLAGLILSGNADKFGASTVIGLKTKKDNVFLAGYDVINKTYQAGYMMGLGKN